MLAEVLGRMPSQHMQVNSYGQSRTSGQTGEVTLWNNHWAGSGVTGQL